VTLPLGACKVEEFISPVSRPPPGDGHQAPTHFPRSGLPYEKKVVFEFTYILVYFSFKCGGKSNREIKKIISKKSIDYSVGDVLMESYISSILVRMDHVCERMKILSRTRVLKREDIEKIDYHLTQIMKVLNECA